MIVEFTETEEVSNELTTVVNNSGLEKTKSQKLLEMFTPYFNKMGEIEGKIKAINAENPGKEDVKIAREIRLALKNNRVAAEKVKDDSKAAIIIEGRLIDNLNNIVKNTSKGLELQCEAIEKDAEIKEQARIDALRVSRVELLAPFVEDANIFPLGTMSEDGFNDLLSGSKLACEAKEEAARIAEELRIKQEAEKLAEDKRIREENERLKKEADEKEAALQAERAEAARLAKIEHDKQATILKAEQEKAAAERKAIEDKARAEAEKAKAEHDRLQAELKSKQDAERLQAERVAAEAKAKADAEKKAAKAPDKDKLKAMLATMPSFMVTGLKSADSEAIAKLISDKFEAFKTWAAAQIETL